MITDLCEVMKKVACQYLSSNAEDALSEELLVECYIRERVGVCGMLSHSCHCATATYSPYIICAGLPGGIVVL